LGLGLLGLGLGLLLLQLLLLLLLLVLVLVLVLLVLLVLVLVLLQADLSHVMLRPFQARVRDVASTHASEDHRNKVRRHTAIDRIAQHGLFDLALVKA
jgi:hypothetical protein